MWVHNLQSDVIEKEELEPWKCMIWVIKRFLEDFRALLFLLDCGSFNCEVSQLFPEILQLDCMVSLRYLDIDLYSWKIWRKKLERRIHGALPQSSLFISSSKKVLKIEFWMLMHWVNVISAGMTLSMNQESFFHCPTPVRCLSSLPSVLIEVRSYVFGLWLY